MSFDKIIAITRQYGSGGHDIGKALAEKLGISFYDKELISIAAKESGVSPEVFKHADERATNSLLYSLSVGLYNYGNNFSSVGDLPVNDRLYILQHKIIKQLAEKENFVVVGRCADYVLKDNPKLVERQSRGFAAGRPLRNGAPDDRRGNASSESPFLPAADRTPHADHGRSGRIDAGRKDR